MLSQKLLLIFPCVTATNLSGIDNDIYSPSNVLSFKGKFQCRDFRAFAFTITSAGAHPKGLDNPAGDFWHPQILLLDHGLHILGASLQRCQVSYQNINFRLKYWLDLYQLTYHAVIWSRSK